MQQLDILLKSLDAALTGGPIKVWEQTVHYLEQEGLSAFDRRFIFKWLNAYVHKLLEKDDPNGAELCMAAAEDRVKFKPNEKSTPDFQALMANYLPMAKQYVKDNTVEAAISVALKQLEFSTLKSKQWDESYLFLMQQYALQTAKKDQTNADFIAVQLYKLCPADSEQKKNAWQLLATKNKTALVEEKSAQNISGQGSALKNIP